MVPFNGLLLSYYAQVDLLIIRYFCKTSTEPTLSLDLTISGRLLSNKSPFICLSAYHFLSDVKCYVRTDYSYISAHQLERVHRSATQNIRIKFTCGLSR